MREWPWVFKDECNGHTRTEHPLHVLAFSFTQSDFNKTFLGFNQKSLRNTLRQEFVKAIVNLKLCVCVF